MSRLKGFNHTQETRKKMSLAKTGKKRLPFSEEWKRKMGLKNKGKVGYWKGKKRSEEYKKKVSLSMRGEKHYNWQKGKSYEPYSSEFNQGLKEQIRKRDQFRCQQCFRHQDELRTKTNIPYELVIHHIDYNKKNSNPDNLISLCRNCHSQTNFSRSNWANYFRSKLL